VSEQRTFTFEELVAYALKSALGYDWKKNVGDPENQAIGVVPGFFEAITTLRDGLEKLSRRGVKARRRFIGNVNGDLLTLLQWAWLRGYAASQKQYDGELQGPPPQAAEGVPDVQALQVPRER
jgi:hypothetical protein